MNIRIPTSADLPDMALILEDTDLFPPDMLDAMIDPFFNDANNQDRWLVFETTNAEVIGFSYTRPEPLAEGTWNLLAIGFRHEHQGKGYGTQLVAAVEQSLQQERILIVETSGLEDFQRTREFYNARGYSREAVIRDYWADGDDKVIYRKALNKT